MDRVKFLFDLRGYFIIRNVLSPREIDLANSAIDKHKFYERKDNLRLTKDNSKLSGDMSSGRLDMGGMLGWSEGSDIFREFLVHPKVVPYLNELVGEGFRLDHSPLVIAQNIGSEGFSLHGGSISSRSGKFVPQLQYVCKEKTIYNSLLAVSFQLTDHNEGSGGFCVVPGSHKINFKPSLEMMDGSDEDFFSDCVVQPVTKAGDVILFSEATIHGCLPWKANYQRRVALYRYSPSNIAFARGYSTGWPDSYLNGMTKQQLSVMQPPYHPIYDRECLDSDSNIVSKGRSKEKKEFDQLVFSEPYY